MIVMEDIWTSYCPPCTTLMRDLPCEPRSLPVCSQALWTNTPDTPSELPPPDPETPGPGPYGRGPVGRWEIHYFTDKMGNVLLVSAAYHRCVSMLDKQSHNLLYRTLDQRGLSLQAVSASLRAAS